VTVSKLFFARAWVYFADSVPKAERFAFPVSPLVGQPVS
jgi:hypothetical protein